MNNDADNQNYINISKQIEVLRLELRECSDLLIHFKIWNESTKEAITKNSNDIKTLESEVENLKQRSASLDGSISSLNKFSTITFTVAFGLCAWAGSTLISIKQDSTRLQENVITNRADIEVLESRIFGNEARK